MAIKFGPVSSSPATQNGWKLQGHRESFADPNCEAWKNNPLTLSLIRQGRKELYGGVHEGVSTDVLESPEESSEQDLSIA